MGFGSLSYNSAIKTELISDIRNIYCTSHPYDLLYLKYVL